MLVSRKNEVNMQLIPFFYLALLTSNFLISEPIELSETRTETFQSNLQLTTHIIDERYCKGKRGSYDSLKIKLKLNFKNIGKKNLILYKGSNPINNQMISYNLDDALAKRYILEMSFTIISSGLPSITGESVPDKNFVIIPPDSSYETNASTDIVLFLNKNENIVFNGSIGVGQYYLKVNVSTWHWSLDLANSLNSRWEEKGDLWFEDVTSLPMLLKIEGNQKLSDCR
jgi:hypothetical protein